MRKYYITKKFVTGDWCYVAYEKVHWIWKLLLVKLDKPVYNSMSLTNSRECYQKLLFVLADEGIDDYEIQDYKERR